MRSLRTAIESRLSGGTTARIVEYALMIALIAVGAIASVLLLVT